MKKKNAKRSPLFYVGDKYKLITEIRTYFPERIDTFVEPFVGGGSVFMNVTAKNFILNDIDSNVIALHKHLTESAVDPEAFLDRLWIIVDHYGLSCSYRIDSVPGNLKLEFPKTYFAKFNKTSYEKLRTDYNASGRTNLDMLYLLLIYGFNRMLRFNSTGDFNLPVGNVDLNLNTVTALKCYFEEVTQKKPIWCNLDFKDFLESLSLNKNDLIYLDPPYLITFSEYNKLWNESTEKCLLDLLDELSSNDIKFAISNVTHYKGRMNKLFLDWASKYNMHSIKSNYISFHDNTNKSFNEVLITNY